MNIRFDTAWAILAVAAFVALTGPRVLGQTRPSEDQELHDISQLVQQDHNDEALKKLDVLIAAYPDDPKLKQLRSEIAPSGAAATPSVSPAPTLPTTRTAGKDRLASVELENIYDDLGHATDAASQKKLMKELFDKSGKYVADHPKDEKVWVLRAFSSLGLNNAMESGAAAKALENMGALDHGNDAELKIIAKIDRNGWITVSAAVTNSIGMRFVEIQPGTFLMGSPGSEAGRFDDEIPHKVTLTKKFMIAATHVTRGQFAAFVNDSAYKTDAEKDGKAWSFNNGTPAEIAGASWRNPGFDQGDDHPVVDVSWNDSIAFCDWLSRKEGKHYRLPTEAEWEYACRAGTQTAYPWGDNPDDGNGWANCADQTVKARFPNAATFNWSDGYFFTSPVGSFRPNTFGLYDMIGNVWEWCNDCYGNYPNGEVTDPQGADNAPARVLRGGSWISSPRFCRSAYRFSNAPAGRDISIGFRVVLDFD